MRFLSNFGCKIILCPQSIFGISKIPAHCLKEALVTSLLSESGLLPLWASNGLFPFTVHGLIW